MTFFKYKWQLFIIVGLFFSFALIINKIAFELMSVVEIALAYLFGFIFTLILFVIRRKEKWISKLK